MVWVNGSHFESKILAKNIHNRRRCRFFFFFSSFIFFFLLFFTSFIQWPVQEKKKTFQGITWADVFSNWRHATLSHFASKIDGQPFFFSFSYFFSSSPFMRTNLVVIKLKKKKNLVADCSFTKVKIKKKYDFNNWYFVLFYIWYLLHFIKP